jgi:hypothetical protein
MSEAAPEESLEPMTFEEAVEYMKQPEGADVHEALKLALMRTPDVAKTADAAGNTLLHHAALNGRLACCVALVESGAHPGVRNKGGENPAHIASALSFTEIVSVVYGGIEKARPKEAWYF